MKKEITILTVEDNPADVALLHECLNHVEDIQLTIMNVDNGEDAINFVRKKGEYSQSPTADIIILDINLPMKDGYEVLDTLKNSIIYRHIPIIIYTTSDEPKDILKSYHKYANSYITKSFDIQELFNKITDLMEYWLVTAKIPNKDYIILEEEEN